MLAVGAAVLSSIRPSPDEGCWRRFRSVFSASKTFDFLLTEFKKSIGWSYTSLRFVSTAGRRAVPKGAALAYFRGRRATA